MKVKVECFMRSCFDQESDYVSGVWHRSIKNNKNKPQTPEIYSYDKLLTSTSYGFHINTSNQLENKTIKHFFSNVFD